MRWGSVEKLREGRQSDPHGPVCPDVGCVCELLPRSGPRSGPFPAPCVAHAVVGSALGPRAGPAFWGPCAVHSALSIASPARWGETGASTRSPPS